MVRLAIIGVLAVYSWVAVALCAMHCNGVHAQGYAESDGRATKVPRSLEAVLGGATAPDGTEVDVDLPKELHLLNCGGSDGAGLCVFTSINHSAYWQNIVGLQGLRDYMRRYPGGGYPEKVTRMMERFCKEQGIPVPEVIQVESRDLEILRSACKTGRMPAVTYSFSPTGRYGGHKISHMVTLVAAGAGKGPDGKGWWAILDNNFPGTIEWMSEAEFLASYTGSGGQGWSVIFLLPGPPPSPLVR